MSEALYSLQPVILSAINSITLAVYYSAHITPKSNRLPAKHIFAAFGTTYFLLQLLVENLLSGLSWAAASFGSIVILPALIYVISLFIFKRNLRLCVFLLFSFFAAQEICLFILLGIGQLFGNAHGILVEYLTTNGYFTTDEGFSAFLEGYAIFQYFAALIIHTVIIIYTLRSITKRFTTKDYVLSSSELSYLLLPCCPGLIITYIIRALLVSRIEYSTYELIDTDPLIDILVPVSGFILLSGMITALWFYQKLVKMHNDETERVVLQQQVQQLQGQINDVDDIYKEIRGFRHDVTSHISNILVLANAITEGDDSVKSELKQYTDKIKDTLDDFEFAYKTGNSISDIIIHQKQMEARKLNIDFSADFVYPGNLNIDAYDLAIILNNALENAIEACAEMKNGYIRLCSYIKGNMFFIDVENNYENAISYDKTTGLPITGKPDKTAHGIGLSNIRRCARKYFGDIDIQVTQANGSSVFRLTVMLQGIRLKPSEKFPCG